MLPNWILQWIFVFDYPAGPRAGRCDSSNVPVSRRSCGKRVFPTGAARQRPRSDTRRLRGPCQEPVLPCPARSVWQIKAPSSPGIIKPLLLGAELPGLSGALAKGVSVLIACVPMELYRTRMEVSHLYLSLWLILTGGLVMWQDLLPTPQKPTVIS